MIQPSTSFEDECRARIETWQKDLGTISPRENPAAIQALKAAVDTQLAIAELKIKVRQADHAKLTVWGPLVVPMIGAAIGAVAGVLLKP